MDKGEKKRFGVIDGGNMNTQTPDQKDRDIQRDVTVQKDLGPTEKLDLVRRMSERKKDMIRESVAKFSDRILNDEEVIFISDRLLRLVSKEEGVIRELKEEFPDLSEYFDDVVSKIN